MYHHDAVFYYQLLYRLQMDCETSILNGYLDHLWGITVKEHISKMREVYRLLQDKPIWISSVIIDLYEKELNML